MAPRPLQPGTKTLATYTLFVSHPGEIIEAPLTAICQSSYGASQSMIERLRSTHGLDIRRVGYRRWMLAGRQLPDGNYVSFTCPRS